MSFRYTTDTHPLVWYLRKSKRLSPKAKEIFDRVFNNQAEIIIPTICLLEVIAVAEKRKLKSEKLDEFLRNLILNPNFVIRELDLEIVIKVKNMLFTKDLHDRIVVATALAEKTPLITKDEKIKKSRLVETVWD